MGLAGWCFQSGPNFLQGFPMYDPFAFYGARFCAADGPRAVNVDALDLTTAARNCCDAAVACESFTEWSIGRFSLCPHTTYYFNADDDRNRALCFA